MVAEGVGRVVNVLFEGVERDHEVGLLADQKGAPQRVVLHHVVLPLRAFSKECSNVVAEGTGRSDGASRLGEGVEHEDLGPAPSLLAWIEEREIHDSKFRKVRASISLSLSLSLCVWFCLCFWHRTEE